MECFRQKEATRAAGRKLADLIDAYRDTPILLVLSGGSAMDMLGHCTIPEDASQIFVTVLDERFNEKLIDQNFAKLKESKFYQALLGQGGNPLDLTETACVSPEALAAALEKNLRDWVNMYPKGKIIATVGVGRDGHIAGLIAPLSLEEETSTQWAIAHAVPETASPFMSRVSITFNFLINNVDHAVVFMGGEEKRDTLEHLLARREGENLFPSMVLYEMKDVSLYTDILSDEQN